MREVHNIAVDKQGEPKQKDKSQVNKACRGEPEVVLKGCAMEEVAEKY